ncbi:FecR domain-containing protein [Leptospira interrogans]|uniref:FecR family protein n=1 Tax=Leptospira interrogans TaxID=173 RepID=UPI0010C12C5D|nr:FecR family protein [Leptospira interrogans]KAA1268740.1 transcriptional regulator [Leptospira interrogans serovar Weerasinghe]KAA1290787.1 transcriptional regulator [Leptospira interrogans serovar Geyaweera]QCO38875.1 transcriptional regulator [Leptospira interrogans]QCO42617.1 transcriptional regulator [Leptospira interrogans]ULG81330.1 FecR domain-containing protein [Leptospira interrogans]
MQKFFFSIFFICILVLNLFFSCNLIAYLFLSKEIVPSKMIIIFHTGEIEIVRYGKILPSSIGLILQECDLIRTFSGSVDIQSGNGNLIRIKPYTEIILKNLPNKQHKETNLYFQSGELLVKTNKLKTDESFFISTSTTVAGVRGSSFSLKLEEGSQSPEVKVYEGAVGMNFKIPNKILEEIKTMNEEIYDEFIMFLKKNEVVLDKGEVSLIKPSLDRMIQLILTKVENKEDISREFASIQKIENFSLQKTTFVETPQEIAEIETLVYADRILVNQALSEQDSNEVQPFISSISSEIQRDQSFKLDQALNKIQAKIERNVLKYESEIYEYYNVLETVVKEDGSKLSGAIVAQVGDTLILHTPKGAIRLNKNEIDYIDYQNSRMKDK